MAELDPRHVTDAVHARAHEWVNAGAHWNLTTGTARDGVIASITCETGQTSIHLTIQADGEAEMKVVEQSAKLTSIYRYRLATPDDVAACLDELTQQIVPRD